MSNIIPAGNSMRSVGLGLEERPMVKAATCLAQVRRQSEQVEDIDWQSIV